MLRRVLQAAAAIVGLLAVYAASVGVVAFGKWAQAQGGILGESLVVGLPVTAVVVFIGGMAWTMYKTFPRGF